MTTNCRYDKIYFGLKVKSNNLKRAITSNLSDDFKLDISIKLETGESNICSLLELLYLHFYLVL